MFTYYYTISDTELVKFGEVDSNIERAACDTDSLKDFFQNGVTMRWSYADSLGKEIHEKIITPQHCGMR